APTGSPRPPGQSPVPARRHAAWHSAAPPRAPAGATDIPSRARPQSARRPPPATDRPHQPTAPARADQPNRGLASLPPPRDQPFYPQATYFPNSYGKRSKAAEIIAERWTPLVIHELLAGSTRFNDIRRGVPLMSQTLLSTRLKELQRAGIVQRRAGGNRGHEWHLTEAGLALGPLIRQLGEWGLQYAHDPLEEGDLDVTVLTWNMRRRVDPTVFPERRITVYFEFTDVPKNKA